MRPEQKEAVIQTPDQNFVERAEVLAVGPSVHYIRPGDKVLFTSFGVDSIDVDGERHYFLLEDDSFILAIEPRNESTWSTAHHLKVGETLHEVPDAFRM